MIVEEADSHSSDLEWFREFILHRRWQRGKADPSHEYTIREWAPDKKTDFLRAVELVRTLGEPARFWSSTYIYLHFDGNKYWTMDDPPESTTVLNRAEP
jgi:hypothetical protein